MVIFLLSICEVTMSIRVVVSDKRVLTVPKAINGVEIVSRDVRTII